MGLFDFVKNAGRKILGRDDEPPAPTESAAVLEARKAKALMRAVRELGFEVENLSVALSGETVTVAGKVDSQADREKVVLVLGNTEGVARVNDQLTVERPEPEATFYTVQSGDSLSKIAKAHYGNAMKYPVIFEANRPMLSDPDKIYPGQVLRIPPQEDKA
ncbi:MAG TPA: peptidoglycan-binding protein LysM [Thermoanaerobaculia bacterium]|nr:peptidoglycan-binding protein LysM [Thermoanaerobaculia bacterium]